MECTITRGFRYALQNMQKLWYVCNLMLIGINVELCHLELRIFLERGSLMKTPLNFDRMLIQLPPGCLCKASFTFYSPVFSSLPWNNLLDDEGHKAKQYPSHLKSLLISSFRESRRSDNWAGINPRPTHEVRFTSSLFPHARCVRIIFGAAEIIITLGYLIRGRWSFHRV